MTEMVKVLHSWIPNLQSLHVSTTQLDTLRAIRQHAQSLQQQISGQSVPSFPPTRESADYQAISDLFANRFRDNARVQGRLNSLRASMQQQNFPDQPLITLLSELPPVELRLNLINPTLDEPVLPQFLKTRVKKESTMSL
jgi:hypothetical protein